MNHPPAPWILKGHGFLTLHLIDFNVAAKVIPKNLEIVQVLPGKTIGGLVLGKYEPSSTLTYGELIAVAGLVRYGGKIGSWVSHIYVDDQSSIAGGRNIWGLPKEEAQFLWQPGGGAIVKQGDRTLCNLTQAWQFNLPRLNGQFDTYTQLAEELMRFESSAVGNLSIVNSRLEVPYSSPFANMIDSQPWMALKAESLEITIAAPVSVGAKVPMPV
ncbi:acetoacetate decarboxylase family protein [Cyanobacteria bacterium FACHB-DQ100]|uniref:acetoacetate decarboxylase family protein n=1 Tax=Leptolyngbya sp. DQ-M1 TaxID=2933920 RepID=UPI00198944D4|nr:acetoacetate decarboxylase family protein [Cyanobacteria bacterium FACHB-DQ100]